MRYSEPLDEKQAACWHQGRRTTPVLRHGSQRVLLEPSAYPPPVTIQINGCGTSTDLCAAFTARSGISPRNRHPLATGSVFDVYLDDHKEFVPWTNRVEKFRYNKETLFAQITVQTADTVRLTYLLELLAKRKRPILFVGTAGTGMLLGGPGRRARRTIV